MQHGNRKLIISANITIDGFISGPNCELGWHFECWTAQMAEFLCAQLEKTDTILLGRKTYQGMAEYWPRREADLSMPVEDRAISELMNRHKKVVFSNTLKNFQWTNTKCLKGNIAVVIDALKHEKGKDIMVYGSGQLSQALFEQGLVDELHLWVHPVALGKGKPLFTGLSKFSLCDVKTFRSGVVVHIYGCRPQTV